MFRFGLLLVAGAASAAQPAAPCTNAGPGCVERVPFGAPGRFAVVYRSLPLTHPDPRVRRALIIVHGAARDAGAYFASGVAAGLIAGALENTVIIAPRFGSGSDGCRDTLAPGEISWTCGGDEDWRGGGMAHGLKVGTFDLVDHLIRLLARRDVFPNLRAIVVTGHSAGGQFTNRYAATTRVEKDIRVPVHYVVANPSSYLYPDAMRLPPSAVCTQHQGCSAAFAPWPKAAECPGYNRWRYGMEQRNGYSAALSDDELRRNLATRDVTYLLGEFDTLPVYGFDSSCAAMAQGPTRLARGIAYWNYLRSRYDARHKLVVVPACGHNGRCMYTADEALPVIFPKAFSARSGRIPAAVRLKARRAARSSFRGRAVDRPR